MAPAPCHLHPLKACTFLIKFKVVPWVYGVFVHHKLAKGGYVVVKATPTQSAMAMVPLIPLGAPELARCTWWHQLKFYQSGPVEPHVPLGPMAMVRGPCKPFGNSWHGAWRGVAQNMDATLAPPVAAMAPTQICKFCGGGGGGMGGAR